MGFVRGNRHVSPPLDVLSSHLRWRETQADVATMLTGPASERFYGARSDLNPNPTRLRACRSIFFQF